jgi:diguanylate cyclase (GGDEF)-like protein
MVPIYNIETVPVGYFISTSVAINYSNIYQQYLFSIAMITTIFIIMIAFSIYISKNRELLTKLSLTDRLTKVDNRRKFEKDLNREISRSKRSKENLSLIMFDIDHFKKINDKYGHHTGDVVLETLADIVKHNIRQEDFLARFGGEEFIIILTSTNELEAFNKAEELRKLIEISVFETLKDITISCGVYQFEINDTYEDVISNVDKAMYCAKESGRNKVFSFSELKQTKK